MSGKAINLIGQTFGRLTVVQRNGSNKHSKSMWLCECACGNVTTVERGSLIRRLSKSCGCLRYETSTKHGMSKSSEYIVWQSMIARCRDSNQKAYKNYGGRGISVCKGWQKFEGFYSDMGGRPSELHSIDRINNDGNYDPSNCHWATQTEQARNKRMPKNNKSGAIGVFRRGNRFTVTIGLNNKNIRLGSFDNIDEAIVARKAGEEKYWDKVA